MYLAKTHLRDNTIKRLVFEKGIFGMKSGVQNRKLIQLLCFSVWCYILLCTFRKPFLFYLSEYQHSKSYMIVSAKLFQTILTPRYFGVPYVKADINVWVPALYFFQIKVSWVVGHIIPPSIPKYKHNVILFIKFKTIMLKILLGKIIRVQYKEVV